MLQAFGHLSAQMSVHILLMNAVAPLLALALAGMASRSGSRWRRLLLPATIAQLAVLWIWHAPPMLDAAMQSAALHLAMQVSLFLCAFWFWSTVFYSRDDRRWRAILALLVTSKLFCLLGVLLVFAPRALYFSSSTAGSMVPSGSLLGDQQLAGLLMLVACPVTYLVAGIVIAARWLGRIDAAGRPVSRPQTARHAA